MTNPTRQEIIEAHDAAEKLAKLAARQVSYATDEEIANSWKKQILAALPPKPQPTMAEVEWDDDKHYLAEAEVRTESEGGVKVVMLNPTPSRQVLCLHRAYSTPGAYRVSPAHLTPTGKRYALMEIQE